MRPRVNAMNLTAAVSYQLQAAYFHSLRLALIGMQLFQKLFQAIPTIHSAMPLKCCFNKIFGLCILLWLLEFPQMENPNLSASIS